MSLKPGTRLGPYEVIAGLGAGGMGEVYSARDTRLDRKVAIKVLSPQSSADPARLQRFVVEAKTVSSLNHPNILTLHEIGESDTGPYLVTELVEGRTIREMLAGGSLPVDRAVDYAIQIAEGLSKAHGAGITHRDLKPENIMVTDDGYVKILDFGLAKLRQPDLATSVEPALTKTGTIVGTIAYISPEQLKGERADHRSDLFGLGIVLFEMLTGRNPFLRGTPAETLSAILHEDPPDARDLQPEVPPDVAEIVARALAKDPQRRPTDTREVAAELKSARQRWESGSGGMMKSTTPGRGKRLAALTGAALLAVVIVGVVVSRIPGWSDTFVLPDDQMAVAVLPIHDASGDSDLDRAGIGSVLTDGLVRILSDVPKVYVVSPFRLNELAASMGQSLDVANQDKEFARDVCRKAQAEAILDGTLSKVSDAYILNVTLTDLSSNRVLGTFRAEADAGSGLLSELTDTAAAEIMQKLAPGPSDEPSIESVATSYLEAYSSFIRGRDLMEVGQWEDAVPELQNAIGIDENMGLAWSALACAYSFANEETKSIAAQKRAEELLDRVNGKERRWIELNGTWVNTLNGPLYRREAERFIKDFPDDREGYYYAGLGAQHLEDDCEAAISFYEKAYKLTPGFYSITKGLVDCHVKMGRPKLAVKALERYLARPMLGSYGRSQAEEELRKLEG